MSKAKAKVKKMGYRAKVIYDNDSPWESVGSLFISKDEAIQWLGRYHPTALRHLVYTVRVNIEKVGLRAERE